jgi:hypothetical protein
MNAFLRRKDLLSSPNTRPRASPISAGHSYDCEGSASLSSSEIEAASVGGRVIWGRSRQRPLDDPEASSAAIAKAARLNSKRCRRPTANWRIALRRGGARPSIFDQPLRFAPRTPCDQIQASSGLSESCPKNADVPKSPFPCSGSPGAVGRHNNTANRVAFGCGCRKHPASGACPHRCAAPAISSLCQ